MDSYKSRRVSLAALSGFKRLKVSPSPEQVSRLKEQLSNLWERQIGKKCPMKCGLILKPKTSQFCHNVALARQGKHTIRNIYLACRTCNKSQRTLSKKDYISLRAAVIAALGEEKWKKVRSWLAGARY